MDPSWMASTWRSDYNRTIQTTLALGRLHIRNVAKFKQESHEVQFTEGINEKLFEQQERWFESTLAETAKFAD